MIAIRTGWRVEWVRALDPEDYAIVVDLLRPPDDQPPDPDDPEW